MHLTALGLRYRHMKAIMIRISSKVVGLPFAFCSLKMAIAASALIGILY